MLDGTITLEARGDASPDTVWERYAEPARWPGWSPQIRRVELDGRRDRLAPGLTGAVHSYGPVPVRFTVSAVDEDARTWSWTVSVGPVHLALDHSVAPDDRVDGRGTLTTLAAHGPWPVLLAYAPLARLALGRLVRP
ncbi:MAG TPA: SRPBCC family protein [Jiangellales bacterium]|nr:SRPBCC family protein [Jiangellales bacterium]